MLKLAILITNLWLHMYSGYEAWTTKYDTMYQQAITKYGLKKYGVDVPLFKAIAVIESKQTPNLKGGGEKAYWGLFQISKELSHIFGHVRQYRVMDPKVNTMVFAKWMRYYIVKWLLPLKPKSMKFDSDIWRTFLYLSHNTGPNLVKWSLKHKYPKTHLVKRLVRYWGKKEGTYRMSLGLLVNKLRVIAKHKAINKKPKVDWWIFRDKMLKKCVKTTPWTTSKWKARTQRILTYQKSKKLLQTGVWDTKTEKSVLKNCR